MSSYLQTLLSYLLIYGYLAIFVITFLGAIALPLPSGTIMMASAAFSTQGYFHFWLVWLVGVAGNMAGDSAGYWLARLYGIPVLQKIGFHHIIHSKSYEASKIQVDRHPILTIYLSRFMTAVAPAVNIVCGVTRLSYKRFLLFEGLGEATEVSIYSTLGLLFGNQWETFNKYSDKFIYIVLAGMLFSFFLWRYIGKKTKVG